MTHVTSLRNGAVWKYDLPYKGGGTVKIVEMPVGARIIHVAMQHGSPRMWALVSPGQRAEKRTFRIVGTGHEEVVVGSRYVGTVMDGPFVWHFFEDPR